MKRAGIVAGAALTVALLAGCSAPAVDEPIESAKPLITGAPARETTSSSEAGRTQREGADEERFLRAIEPAWRGEESPAELVEYGYAVCSLLDSGASIAEATVLDPSAPEAEWNEAQLGANAPYLLCPEYAE